MRTTLDIDDDVLAAAKELSRRQGRSAGAVVSALLRHALTGLPSQTHTTKEQTPVAGFRPFPSRGTVITDADIDTLRDGEGV